MFSKLAFIVLSLGVTACSLLAMRQSRLQVASELTQAQLRINQADDRLWLLRARIAESVSPDRVQAMTDTLGPLDPVVEAPSPEHLRAMNAPEPGSAGHAQPPRARPSAVPVREARR